MRKRAVVLLLLATAGGCIVTEDGVKALAVPTSGEEAVAAAAISVPLLIVSGLAVAVKPSEPRLRPRHRAPRDDVERELEARWRKAKRRHR